MSPVSFKPDPDWIHSASISSSPHRPDSLAAGAAFRQTVPIVIAEDDPVSREVVSTMVEKLGFRTILAQNGNEAMTAIRSQQGPILAILDWMMPGMDGLEVCRRVREGGKLVYIILLTARAAKESLVEGLQSGADDYLVKPFDKNELLARIHAGLRIINLQESLADRVNDLEKALQEVTELRREISIPI